MFILKLSSIQIYTVIFRMLACYILQRKLQKSHFLDCILNFARFTVHQHSIQHEFDILGLYGYVQCSF